MQDRRACSACGIVGHALCMQGASDSYQARGTLDILHTTRDNPTQSFFCGIPSGRDRYGLRLPAECDVVASHWLQSLRNECNELIAILTSIVQKVRD